MSRTKRILAGLAALIALLALLSACKGSEAGDGQPIEVVDAVATVTMDNAAIYFTIKNHADESDWLTGVESQDGQTAGLHETVIEGAAESMRPLERLEVPAGGETVLMRGGPHIMLEGLIGPLKEGDTLHMYLRFEKAGLVHIHPQVTDYFGEPQPSGGMGDMGH